MCIFSPGFKDTKHYVFSKLNIFFLTTWLLTIEKSKPILFKKQEKGDENDKETLLMSRGG